MIQGHLTKIVVRNLDCLEWRPDCSALDLEELCASAWKYRMSQAVALISDNGKLLKARGIPGAWQFYVMDPGQS